MKLRTTYQGPVDLPSGRARGSRIVVEQQNYGNWTRKSYPYDHGERDMHRAAVVAHVKDWPRPDFLVRELDEDAKGRRVFEVPDAWPREEADRLRSLALSNLRGDADHRAGHPDGDEASRHLTRENCAACALTGYGADTDGAPNYAAWPRVYVQAGRAIPAEWRPAFEAELDDENESYRDALRRDVATWGVKFRD